MSARTALLFLVATAVAAFGHLSAAYAQAPLTVPPILFKERQLSNGLRVVTAANREAATVSIQVWYHVGARNDPPGRSGFAHLFEHMMFKGSKHMQSEQFDRLTEDIGGENNAFTSEDVTVYIDTVPANHLEPLLWAEAERMSNLQVVEATFQSEREVVKEEYRQRVLASPYGRFQIALPASTYIQHPYRRPTIGSLEDLDGATLAEVQAFHRTFYRPDNATLVVVGDFDADQLDAWVDKYFAPVPRPDAPLPAFAGHEPAWPTDRTASVRGPNVPLPAVALAWQGPARTHPDVPALQVAAALLSWDDASRLKQALVYRQRLATMVSFRADLRVGPGLLKAIGYVAPGKSPTAVATALDAEVRRLARHGPGAAELRRVKAQLLTSYLAARQTSDGLAYALGEAAVLDGDADHANRELVLLQRVTAEDVRRVLRRYVLEGRRVALDYRQGTPARRP